MQGQVTVDTFDDTPLAGDSDQRAARQEVTEFHGYYGAECGTSFGTAARDTQRHSSTPPSSSALQPKLSSPIAPPSTQSTASGSLTLPKQAPPAAARQRGESPPSYYTTYGQLPSSKYMSPDEMRKASLHGLELSRRPLPPVDCKAPPPYRTYGCGGEPLPSAPPKRQRGVF